MQQVRLEEDLYIASVTSPIMGADMGRRTRIAIALGRLIGISGFLILYVCAAVVIAALVWSVFSQAAGSDWARVWQELTSLPRKVYVFASELPMFLQVALGILIAALVLRLKDRD